MSFDSHITGFRKEISKAANASDNAFFGWFDNAQTKEIAFVRGSWDFAIHVAQPLAPFISSPEEKVALEIGHGGGRLLAAACRAFRHVTGVDVHDNNAIVIDELHARGIHNYRLLQTDGDHIPVDDHSIDCVYSFIVLQHVEKLEIFKRYLSETFRVLKPNGVAVLYFGRKTTFSHNRSAKLSYWADRVIEQFTLPHGYLEKPAPINGINLLVSLPYAKSLAKSAGFEIRKTLVSRKSVPDGVANYGGQHGLVLCKSNLHS